VGTVISVGERCAYNALSSFPLCLSVKRAPVAQRTERVASDQKPPSAVLRAWSAHRNGSGFPLSGCPSTSPTGRPLQTRWRILP